MKGVLPADIRRLLMAARRLLMPSLRDSVSTFASHFAPPRTPDLRPGYHIPPLRGSEQTTTPVSVLPELHPLERGVAALCRA